MDRTTTSLRDELNRVHLAPISEQPAKEIPHPRLRRHSRREIKVRTPVHRNRRVDALLERHPTRVERRSIRVNPHPKTRDNVTPEVSNRHRVQRHQDLP
ncbi:hypothetical protein ACFPRL_27025 [Pseudoclavibacter helvolus]